MSARIAPRACVMGHPVAHSRSPMLHGYWLRTLGIDGANGFAGGNITKPHKEQAFRLVDRREPAADAIVYDAVYVPLETGLLKAARRAGHRTVDGLSMLLHQAVPGFAHWFGVTPKVTAEQRAILEADIRAKSGG